MIVLNFLLVNAILARIETEGSITSRRNNSPSSSSFERVEPKTGQRLAHRLRRRGPRIATGLNQKSSTVLRDDQPSLSHFARSFPFPTYAVPPQTSFSCSNVNLPGFYADPETQCQVIRRCTLSNYMFTYICPNGTVFDQAAQGCAYWYNVNCPRELQQLNKNQIPVPLVAVPEGIPPPDFQLRSSFVQRGASSGQQSSSSTKIREVTQQIGISPNVENSGPTPPTKLSWLPSRDPRFPSGQNRPEILSVGMNQPNPSLSTLQSQLSLEAKTAGQKDGTAISTLMQWVGANPIWVPRREQLLNIPTASFTPAPTPSQTSIPWTASAMSPDRDEASTRKPSRTMIVNLGEKEGNIESGAGDDGAQSSESNQPSTQQVHSAMTSPQTDDVSGNVVNKDGRKKALKTSVVNNEWHPLTDFG